MDFEWDASDWAAEQIDDLLQPFEEKVEKIMQYYYDGLYELDKEFIIDRSRTYLMMFKTAFQTFDMIFYNDAEKIQKFVQSIIQETQELPADKISFEEHESWRQCVLVELHEVDTWLQECIDLFY